MNVTITPSALSGTVPAVPSKSAAHRLLICAALADKPTNLMISGSSADIKATVDCLRALGADIKEIPDGLIVNPIKESVKSALLDCGESGSTLRFLIPPAIVLCDEVSFAGHGRLPERPIDHLRKVLEQHGAVFSSPALPFSVTGQLTGGEYALPGNVSSQYISGLLFALPMLPDDSEIVLTTKLESTAYVDMTLDALRRFGIKVERTDNSFFIKGCQKYISPGTVEVEGDWSNSAFFLAAGAIGESCTVTGIDPSSGQGDRAMLDILRRFGAVVKENGSSVTVSPARLNGCDVDISEIPDLLPILAVTAGFARGESRFINGARLRLKESDRLASTASMLKAIGVEVIEGEDNLTVVGGKPCGGVIDGCNDHRIVMAGAIAAIGCAESVTITDAQAANKSYPAFFDDYISLGGVIEKR